MVEDQDKEVTKDTKQPENEPEYPDTVEESTLGDNPAPDETRPQLDSEYDSPLDGWIEPGPKDPRQGWLKVILPGVMQMFGAMIGAEDIMLAPYLYCKIDGEAAFDPQLSVPMVALTDVIIVRIDEAQTPGKVVVHLHSLAQVHPENENRCYIPAAAIPVIIPIRPDHVNIQKYINAATDSNLVIPSEMEVAKIIDVSGKAVEKTR